MLRKLGSAIVGVISAMVARTSTFASSVVDIKDYDGNFIIQQYSESANGADVTLNGTVQQSVDGSTDWTTVTAFAEVDNAAGGSFESAVVEIDGLNRYIRYVGVIVGTTPSIVCGVSFLGYKK